MILKVVALGLMWLKHHVTKTVVPTSAQVAVNNGHCETGGGVNLNRWSNYQQIARMIAEEIHLGTYSWIKGSDDCVTARVMLTYLDYKVTLGRAPLAVVIPFYGLIEDELKHFDNRWTCNFVECGREYGHFYIARGESSVRDMGSARVV